jgi:outer membrane protein TolC
MRARENVEPIGPNLKLEEAIARGLKYNLDYRTKLMREAIAMGASQLSNYDMLPKIVSNAGYTFRNNSFITSATGAYDGSPSLSQPFVTSERSYGNAGISLNWSVLDFGVSYYEAQENADKVLVAAQERRKSMHSLEQDIIIAYLRAAAMQKLHDQILKAREQGQKALATRVKPAGMGFDLF